VGYLTIRKVDKEAIVIWSLETWKIIPEALRGKHLDLDRWWSSWIARVDV